MKQEYIRRHNPIWPELAAHYRAHGVGNFSIFSPPGSNLLFGYFEVEDEEAYNRSGEAELCRLWWKYMAEVLVCERPGDEKGREVMLTEVFRLD